MKPKAANKKLPRLTKDEAWEAFRAWHSRERNRYWSFPSRSLWKRRARALGLTEKWFEQWAAAHNWWEENGKHT